MSVARNLNVNLAAHTDQHDAKIQKSQKHVESFSHSFEQAKSKIEPFFAILAGAAGAEGLRELVKGQMEFIDKNAKLAFNLRSTTEGLGGLQYAATLAGVDQEQLTKSMTHLTKSIGEARSGSKEAQAGFAALGLNFNELANMPTDKAMLKIADAVQKNGNSVGTASALMDIFGAKIGGSLVTMLSQGSAGLMAATDEAKAFGLAINEVDSAKVEAANEAWIKVGEAAKGVGTTIAVGLAPYLEAVADKLTETSREGKKVEAVKWAFSQVGTAAAYVADAVDVVRLAFYALQGGAILVVMAIVKGIQLVVEGVAKAAEALGISNGLARNASDFLQGMVDNLFSQMEDKKKSFDKIMAEPPNSQKIKAYFDDINKKADDNAKAMEDKRKKSLETGKNVDAAAQIKSQQDALKKKIADASKKDESPAEKAKREMTELDNLVAKAKELKVDLPVDFVANDKARIRKELVEGLKKGDHETKHEKTDVSTVTRFSTEGFEALFKQKEDKDPLLKEQQQANTILASIDTELKRKNGTALQVAKLN